MGSDTHFLLPLLNEDHMCFSIQGQPNLVYNSMQLNGQLVLAAEEESHTITNVSMFLGDLGLAMKNPETVNIVKGHSVKNKPVISIHLTVLVLYKC